MYSLSPGLSEMLANERIADLSRDRAALRPSRPSFGRLRTFRIVTGWTLVAVGLRLAVPRRNRDDCRDAARRYTTVRVAP
jgi:hypothetical protein